MKLIDLFCGGGGSSAGFHQAGFTTLKAVDTAWHCYQTMCANFGKIGIQADISAIRVEKIIDASQKVDLVIASPPCEPYTAANERRILDAYTRMFDDPVGRLMIDAVHLIADIDPEFFMIENVRGILDGDNRDLLFEEIVDQGLGDPFFTVVNAPSWGVPSERVRVFISNFKLPNLNIQPISSWSAINDLPEPNYPTNFQYHTTSGLNENKENEISKVAHGEGMVYFRGAHRDFKNYIRIYPDRPAPVVMGKTRFVHPFEDRLLTPQEHARLMTFPDDYTYIGTREQIYDIIGEAVPPKITFEIGKHLAKLL